MTIRIEQLETWVRPIGPPRMDFQIGNGQSIFPEWMRFNVEVQVFLRNAAGVSAWGCAADWPSFGWLDKRPHVPGPEKLRQLLELVQQVAQLYRELPPAETPFAWWREAWAESRMRFAEQPSVELCATFAHALCERAVVDAWCRLHGVPFHQALREDRLGLDLGELHPELRGRRIAEWLPAAPRRQVFIRHTVGTSDPLTSADLNSAARDAPDELWALSDYVQHHGLMYFKVKLRADQELDLARLRAIWQVVRDRPARFTLDGNEAYSSPAALADFLHRLRHDLPEVFERLLYVEQPLDRQATLDPSTTAEITAVSHLKPLIIDEADGTLTAFREALAIGYRGVSYKNCKGLFKSLGNFALAAARSTPARPCFLSSEDLTNLPPVALPQDLAVVATLGLTHSERNGQHFFRGLAHLSAREQSQNLAAYPHLYRRGACGHGELHIGDGQVELSDLHPLPGLGLAVQPDWTMLTPLATWLRQ